MNSRGEVIEGGFQHGVLPLLDGTDEQQMYLQSLSNITSLQRYGDRLGKVRWSITAHDKVTLLTFPFGDGILCLSTSSKADPVKVRDKVMKAIRSSRARKEARKRDKAKG
ncbi:MAG: hypothetical protein ACREA4_13475 [Nitrososphaera sp.]